MRRNPKAEVMKQGWLYKQASNGVKQWNKRWFVLTDHCLFYYKDEKEEAVLGSIPLLSFWISLLQPSDNINRKHAFKASWCREAEGYGHSNGSSSLCPQAEHAGVRTYFFSAESQEEQETWIRAMSEAARVHIPPIQRNNSENIPPAVANMVIVAKGAEPRQRGEGDGRGAEIRESSKQELNGIIPAEAMTPPTPRSPMTPELDGRGKERGERRQRQPNGWGGYGRHTSAFRPQAPRDPRDSREAVVLRRGFVPRTQPERQAQRKSSMTQLQQWVNQRRTAPPPEDLRSPGTPTEYYGVYGPQFVNEYGMYPPGVRPDSICSESGFEGVPPRWAMEDRRRSLRDGAKYPQERTRDVGVRGGYVWAAPNPAAVSPAQHTAYYAQLQSAQSSLHRLSLQPRSRSVPRSPSSSQGPYPPGSRAFSPVRSPSARFERGPAGHHRDGHIYADPAAHTMRRSISSPKYEYPQDRRSIPQEMYHYSYPASPSLQDKMASWCREAEGYGHSNGSSSLCPQAEHAGVRTYFFSAESQEEQETWIRAMSEAARVHIPPIQRNNSENIPPAVANMVIVAKGAEPRQRGEGDGRGAEIRESSKQELNGMIPAEAMTPPTPRSPMTPELDGRGKERGERRQRQPNGWGGYGRHTSAFRPQAPRDPRDSREAVVLRRGFVPRTQPERQAQRKSSMTQLQQWVNQRRTAPPPEDLRSPGTPTEYYGVYGPQFVNEYGMYPPGVRPDSICSESGFEGVPPRWAMEDRRRSLRDGAKYPQERTRDVGVRGGYVWAAPNPAAVSPAQHTAYYAQLQSAQSSLHRLSLQPRSRSVPRSPSSSQGPYPPGSRAFSPVRSPSARFERGPAGHHRDGHIYADPAAHTMRRSISSPKYEYPRDRRSIPQEMYHYNYPASPSLQDKMEDILDLQLQRNLEYLDQQVGLPQQQRP
ncbi:UNVERIFIED_CONTAM: hypothetical protein FKN15_049896 [Acipenser sinensis]